MSTEKFSSLKRYFPFAEALTEAGQTVAYLPGLKVETSAGIVDVNALLVPFEHTSYRTRLFTDRQISAPNAKNWTSHTVCGRSWWVCSWNEVPSTLPWIEILANHLRAFR